MTVKGMMAVDDAIALTCSDCNQHTRANPASLLDGENFRARMPIALLLCADNCASGSLHPDAPCDSIAGQIPMQPLSALFLSH
jgi:hypothetical protein